MRHRRALGGLALAVLSAAACSAIGPSGDRHRADTSVGGEEAATSSHGSGGFEGSGSSGAGGGGLGPAVEQTLCDDGLLIADDDPLAAARALELCKQSGGPDDWGLLAARWVMPDGSPPPASQAYHRGHGLASSFGHAIAPRAGSHMLVLSSGTARRPSDTDYQSPSGFDKGYVSAHPAGFPKEAPSCPGTITGQPHDGAALEVEMRAPANATGLVYDIYFLTFEWPEYVCDVFNDFFVALMSPKVPALADENISFDKLGNPISVNAAFIDVCDCAGGPPCNAGGKTFACAQGSSDLVGTGFGAGDDPYGEDHGGTGWLETSAPIVGGNELRLRFAIYDSADGVLDSTILIDNFRWVTDGEPPPETKPVPK